ncbi:MAG: hypothetical protein ACI4QC_03690, partial [Thermoguttaceae bacterium]
DALFKFRRSIVSELQKNSIPYVEEETPIVLAWYPDVKLAYLWNLNNSEIQLHVRAGEKRIATKLEGRGSALIEI